MTDALTATLDVASADAGPSELSRSELDREAELGAVELIEPRLPGRELARAGSGELFARWTAGADGRPKCQWQSRLAPDDHDDGRDCGRITE
jgi:hypothetical protein